MTARRAPMARIVVPHSKSCWARGKKVRAGDLYCAGDASLFANAWGLGKGSHLWIVIRCNCSSCEARIIVRHTAVAELVARLLRASAPARDVSTT